MKNYNLIFAFDQNLDNTVLRTMPDGRHKSCLNGIGGKLPEHLPPQHAAVRRQTARYIDMSRSELKNTYSTMTIHLPGGNAAVHVYACVFDELHLSDEANCRVMPVREAMFDSLETELDALSRTDKSIKYTPGYYYFLREAYLVTVKNEKKGKLIP